MIGLTNISIKVLFIDEVHMLDIECFSFLNRAIEDELAPLVIMASNKGMATVRGTTFKSPHGLPPDLLDRILIISTQQYTQPEVEQIIQIRCVEEDVELAPEALTALATLASSTTLRYVLNLISTAQVISRKRRGTKVEVEDVRKCYGYFLDEKRSTQWLEEQQGSLVFETKVDQDVAMATA